MGRLSTHKPRLSMGAPRLGHATGDERARNQKRYEENDWRAWYGTKRWRDLKTAAHVRDRYVCQRTGELCVGRYPAPNSPVANHKIPHRGDPALFWDIDNIETVMKSVHDGEIQREEQAVPRGVWR